VTGGGDAPQPDADKKAGQYLVSLRGDGIVPVRSESPKPLLKITAYATKAIATLIGDTWVTGRRTHAIRVLSMLVLLLIGWIDYITGYELGFFIFYFIPVAISSWFISRRSGLFMACTAAIVWYLSDRFTFHPYSHAYLIYWEMWMRFVSFLTTALTVARIRANLEREKELNTELARALREIEELKVSLPDGPPNLRHGGDPACRREHLWPLLAGTDPDVQAVGTGQGGPPGQHTP